MRCSKQWSAAYYLVGRYFLILFARGIPEPHFWRLFRPVWYSPSHTSKSSGYCIIWHVVVRLVCSLVAGSPIQLKFKLTNIFATMTQDFLGKPGSSFKLSYQISVAEADSGGIGGTPVGRVASATLSGIILLTSLLRWMTMVCWSCPNSLIKIFYYIFLA